MYESIKNVVKAAIRFRRPSPRTVVLHNVEVDEVTRRRMTLRDLVALDGMLAGKPGSHYTLKRVD